MMNLQVTLMLRNFTDIENQTESPQKEEVIQEVNRYNRRFSGQPIPVSTMYNQSCNMPSYICPICFSILNLKNISLQWIDYIRDLPTILRHCFRLFFSVSGLLLMFRIRILVILLIALLYFLSPFDIIPEAAFGILGLLDDFFILLLVAIYVSVIYRRYVANQANA
jgi:RING finger protein 170